MKRTSRRRKTSRNAGPKRFAGTVEYTDDRGEQFVYKFSNSYGASVIRSRDYPGKWELAVLRKSNDGSWDLYYYSPITSDVIPRLSFEDVIDLLAKINSLPPARG